MSDQNNPFITEFATALTKLIVREIEGHPYLQEKPLERDDIESLVADTVNDVVDITQIASDVTNELTPSDLITSDFVSEIQSELDIYGLARTLMSEEGHTISERMWEDVDLYDAVTDDHNFRHFMDECEQTSGAVEDLARVLGEIAIPLMKFANKSGLIDETKLRKEVGMVPFGTVKHNMLALRARLRACLESQPKDYDEKLIALTCRFNDCVAIVIRPDPEETVKGAAWESLPIHLESAKTAPDETS